MYELRRRPDVIFDVRPMSSRSAALRRRDMRRRRVFVCVADVGPTSSGLLGWLLLLHYNMCEIILHSLKLYDCWIQSTVEDRAADLVQSRTDNTARKCLGNVWRQHSPDMSQCPKMVVAGLENCWSVTVKIIWSSYDFVYLFRAQPLDTGSVK